MVCVSTKFVLSRFQISCMLASLMYCRPMMKNSQPAEAKVTQLPRFFINDLQKKCFLAV